MTTPNDDIAPSVRAFLHGLIDYAGLFPPASLSLEEAFANFRRYQRGSDGWMLGRFIVPVARLDHLSRLLEEGGDEADPLPLSLLGRAAPDADSFMTTLAEDVAVAARFAARHGAAVQVGAWEGKLPADLLALAQPTAIATLLEQAAEAAAPLAPLPLFWEAPPHEAWEAQVARLIEAIRLHNASTERSGAAFKVRCGGTPDPAFPSPEQLAYALELCCAAGVPLKGTAGLHHPLRHRPEQGGPMMHGFVNLFGGGILAQSHALGLGDLQTLIEECDPAAFRFTPDGLAWRNLAVTTAQIEAARQQALLSYGSCSFDEPRDDLRAIGLL